MHVTTVFGAYGNGGDGGYGGGGGDDGGGRLGGGGGDDGGGRLGGGGGDDGGGRLGGDEGIPVDMRINSANIHIIFMIYVSTVNKSVYFILTLIKNSFKYI